MLGHVLGMLKGGEPLIEGMLGRYVSVNLGNPSVWAVCFVTCFAVLRGASIRTFANPYFGKNHPEISES